MTAPAPLDPRAPPPRWWTFVEEGRLFCPAHHHIPNAFGITEAGFIRCLYAADTDNRQDVARTGGGERQRPVECGLWVFLFAIRGGGIITAAVTYDEMRLMKRLSTPAEMFRYLGIFARGPQRSPGSSSRPASG